MKTKIFLGGAVLVAVVGVWGDAHATVPDPTKTIVTGAYWLPYPVSNPAQYYAYQRIAGAGLDVIITIQKQPADPAPDNTYDFNSQSAMIEKAAATNPPLWVIVERRENADYGIFWDNSPNYSQVDTLMNQSAFLTATNIYGWATWHEPSGYLLHSAQLDLYVRQAAAALAPNSDPQWTTFVGWFDVTQRDSVDKLLGYLDANDYPGDGPEYHRRPVFGVEAYRFRNTPEVEPGCTSFATSSLNYWLGGLRDVVLEHPYQYPWWSIVTVTDYICCCHPNNGPPSKEALRMDVFTHLAWGAKGIFYYTYMHNDDTESSWGDPSSAEHWPGVFNASSGSGYTEVDASDPFNDVYDWITDINEDIDTLKAILGPAEIKRPVVGTPYHYYYESWADDYAEPSSFVDSLVISPVQSGVNAIATPMTISDRDVKYSNYALVVNQWETDVYSNDAAGPINITLTINADSLGGSGDYLIAEDTLSGRWLIANDFVIEDELAAGEAKMYRLWRWDGGNLTIPANTTVKCLTPISISGTVTVGNNVTWETMAGNITIQNGGTLSLGSGVTIPFEQSYGNYRMVVNGGGMLDGASKTASTINGRVEVTGNGATVQDLTINWPDTYGTGYAGVSFSGSSSTSTLLNCRINGYPNQNGVYAVYCYNAGSGLTIRGCTFKNVYAGVYAYNGSDPYLWSVSGSSCGATSSANDVFESTCTWGLYAYLQSEFWAGHNGDPDWVGANNFDRPNNGSSSGGHVYANTTGTQWCDFNYWNGGPDTSKYQASISTSSQCGQFQEKPTRPATEEVRPIIAAIDEAASPVKTGDTTTAVANLENLALEQTETLNGLFVLDRITEITPVDRAAAAVWAVRTSSTNPALQQATAWMLGRITQWKGDPTGAAQWYATVRDYRADDTLAVESKFTEAEVLLGLPDQQGRATKLYTEFLAEAREDNPNRRIAEGRLRAIQSAEADRVGQTSR